MELVIPQRDIEVLQEKGMFAEKTHTLTHTLTREFSALKMKAGTPSLDRRS